MAAANQDPKAVNQDPKFDFDFYLLRNPDLRHMSYEEALHHWKECGKKEGREGSKDEFKKLNKITLDPKFYKDFYHDVTNFTDAEALVHYVNHGRHEGRLPVKKILNQTTKIGIIIHLYETSLAPEMLEYQNCVKGVFAHVHTLISVSDQIKDSKVQEIQQMFPSAYIYRVPNKGVDVLPFINAVQYIRQNKIEIDYIFKIHTKLSNNPGEGLPHWRKQLIVPIVRYKNLCVLQHYFKKYDNIGYVSAQSCVLPKNYDLDFPQNIDGVNELINKFPHLEKDWTDFNGGNMFWISYKVIDQYLTDELIDYMIPKFNEGKPPNNLKDKGIYIDYLCERLFTGVFCYDKMNIFLNDDIVAKRGLGIENGSINHKYFYQPRVFSFSKPKDLIVNSEDIP